MQFNLPSRFPGVAKNPDKEVQVSTSCINESSYLQLIKTLGDEYRVDTIGKGEKEILFQAFSVLEKLGRTVICSHARGIGYNCVLNINKCLVDPHRGNIIIPKDQVKGIVLMLGKLGTTNIHIADGALKGKLRVDKTGRLVFVGASFSRTCKYAKREARRFELTPLQDATSYLEKGDKLDIAEPYFAYHQGKKLGIMHDISPSGMALLIPSTEGMYEKLQKRKENGDKLPIHQTFIEQGITINSSIVNVKELNGSGLIRVGLKFHLDSKNTYQQINKFMHGEEGVFMKHIKQLIKQEEKVISSKSGLKKAHSTS